MIITYLDGLITQIKNKLDREIRKMLAIQKQKSFKLLHFTRHKTDA